MSASMSWRWPSTFAWPIFEVEPARLDPELLGWFLRAAYGQGYTDALRETRRGQLCLDLGYRVPDRTA
jgi:hypothetical protein